MTRYRGILIGIGLLLGLCVPQEAVAQRGPGPCESPECCREADGAELHGRVQTAESGAAIPGATVTLRITAPPEEGATSTRELPTAEDGTYRLCSIPTPARLEARAERSGATSRSVSFRLDGPDRLELSFEIQGLPANLDSLETAAAAAADDVEPGRIVGRIEDAETGRPVADATLTLKASDRQALTDSRGRFTIPEAPSGRRTLAIHHVAYGDQTVEVDVPSELTVNLDIELPPKAIEVEPIDVRVEATIRSRFLERKGFYDRMERDFGHFWSPEDLERRNPLRVSHVLQQTPGVKVTGAGIPYMASAPPQATGSISRSTSTGRGGVTTVKDNRGFLVCAAQLYVDGVKVTGAPDALIHAQDLAAIEIYRGAAGMAPEFIDSNAACGVIALWTKRGPGPPSDTGGQP